MIFFAFLGLSLVALGIIANCLIDDSETKGRIQNNIIALTGLAMIVLYFFMGVEQ